MSNNSSSTGQTNNNNAPYTPVTGPNVAGGMLTTNEIIVQVLYWIGFTSEAQRQNLIDKSFTTFDDIRMMSTLNVNEMAQDWSARTQVNSRMNFGSKQTKLLKALIHWTQDFYRVSSEPVIEGLCKTVFIWQLRRALSRATTRKTLHKQTKTVAKAATPAPLNPKDNGNSGKRSSLTMPVPILEPTAYHYHTLSVSRKNLIRTISMRTSSLRLLPKLHYPENITWLID